MSVESQTIEQRAREILAHSLRIDPRYTEESADNVAGDLRVIALYSDAALRAVVYALNSAAPASPIIAGKAQVTAHILDVLKPYLDTGDSRTAEDWAIKIAHRITFIDEPMNPPASPSAEHPDEIALKIFASRMHLKLVVARARGRNGWETATAEHLSELLRAHVEKGDPVDVANFCMFLSDLGHKISPARQA